MSDRLVMGAAIGLSAEHVIPFLRSLRDSGYSGDAVLFVDRRLARALRTQPEAKVVQLIGVAAWPPSRFRFMHRPRAMRMVWSPIRWTAWFALQIAGRLPGADDARLNPRASLAQLACTPMDSRFLQYHRWLRTHSYARVLLTDVRDVLFQDEPFAGAPAKGLAVSIETARYTIASESHNAAWIRRAYGSGVLAAIAEMPVSCVGVTYGDYEAITAYVRRLVDEVLRLSPRKAGVAGADTAAHNFLLWTGRLGPFRRLETMMSPVATLNGLDQQEMQFARDGRLVNIDGTVPSVVHQYDRIGDLGLKLLQAVAVRSPIRHSESSTPT